MPLAMEEKLEQGQPAGPRNLPGRLKGWLWRKKLCLAAMVLAALLVYGYAKVSGPLLRYAQETKHYCVHTQEYDTALRPLEPGVVYRQPFTAWGDSLLRMEVSFYDLDPGITGTLAMRLMDKNGDLVSEYLVELADLPAGVYWYEDGVAYVPVYPELVHLKKGQDFYLELEVLELDGRAPSVQTLVGTQAEPVDDMGLLQADGQESDETLYIWYRYYTHVYDWVPAVCLAYLLFVVILFLPLPRAVWRWLTGIAAAVAPLAAYLWFEGIMGHWEYLSWQMVGYNLLLWYPVGMLLVAVFGLRAGAVLTMAVGGGLGLANYLVQGFRGTPICFSDFMALGTAAEVAGGYDYKIPAVWIAALLGLFSAMVAILRSGKWQFGLLARRAVRWAARAVMAVAGAVMLVLAYQNMPIVPQYNPFVPSSTYRHCGWMYTNFVMWQQSRLPDPDGYDADYAAGVLAQADAEVQAPAVVQPQNLIVIMNESLGDMQAHYSFSTNRDPLEYYHSLENVQKGYLAVHVFGGSTSNSEWEVLTGNNMRLTQTSLNPYTIFYTSTGAKYNDSALPQAALEAGYSTTAMHPMSETNWNRNVVYPLLGFERFVSATGGDYDAYPTLRGYTSDLGDYQALIDAYEANAGAKQMFFNVTMQNHGGYTDFLDVPREVWATDVDYPELDLYLSLAYQSDQAIRYLLEYFEQVEEPTMIVIFGDHQAAMPAEFYDEMIELGQEESQVTADKHLTPYLIWTNYDREYEEIPVMSTNYLGPYIKQQAGLPLTAYDKFSLQQMESYPGIGQMGLYDAEGNLTFYDDLDEAQNAWMNTFRFVQYYNMKRKDG